MGLDFEKALKEMKAERRATVFICWGQFVFMLFCQLEIAHSLRKITSGLRSCEGGLKHLGIKPACIGDGIFDIGLFWTTMHFRRI